MNEEQKQAYEWALNKAYPSVDAKYAKVLASLIQEQENTILEIELNYPNWREKFDSLATAIKWHTDGQDRLIANLRARLFGG
jgi:hypothetical protein